MRHDVLWLFPGGHNVVCSPFFLSLHLSCQIYAKTYFNICMLRLVKIGEIVSIFISRAHVYMLVSAKILQKFLFLFRCWQCLEPTSDRYRTSHRQKSRDFSSSFILPCSRVDQGSVICIYIVLLLELVNQVFHNRKPGR